MGGVYLNGAKSLGSRSVIDTTHPHAKHTHAITYTMEV